MNQQQIKYARQRLEKIFSEKRKSIESACTVEANTLSYQGRLDALKAGRFTVVKHDYAYQAGYADRIDQYIKFTDETPKNFDKVSYDKAIKTLTDKYEKALDELILGDNQEALEMIKQFEAEPIG